MTQTWPPPTPHKPPTPALWAPKSRWALLRLLHRLDQRKARHSALQAQIRADAEWREQYLAWFIAYGWQNGAAHPNDAWNEVLRNRRPPTPPEQP